MSPINLGTLKKGTIGGGASGPSIIDWTIGSASYDSVFLDVSGQDIAPRSCWVADSGTRLYMIGLSNDSVYQYDLPTPYILTGAVFVNSFSVATEDTSPYALVMHPDGTSFYMSGIASDRLRQYTMSTPWDITTASSTSSLDVSAQDNQPRGMYISTDGTKGYMVGVTNDNVHQYTMSTPWVLSTMTYDSVSYDVQAAVPLLTVPNGMAFSATGEHMFVCNASAITYQFSLSTPWDISTASYDTVSFDSSSEDTSLMDVRFADTGSGVKMYLVGNAGRGIDQYSL